jgi:zinc protease
MLNQPYGLFYAIDLPGKAFDKFPNAHNFYGDFKDLDAATIGDVQTFFEHHYAPNNAVLCIAGDVKAEEVFQQVEKYFGAIPRRDVPPKPDVSEPDQKAERRATQPDKFAQVPALAIGYRMPPRKSHDAVVAAVLGELLHNGQASRLYQALVKKQQVALSADGGMNWPLGNAFEYDGPTLMTSLIVYPQNIKESQVLGAYDDVIAELAKDGPADAEMDRIRAKMRSDWYGQLEAPIDRAAAMAHATLFDGDPERVNQIPDELAKVTAVEIREFVRKYLVATNRTMINRVPEAGTGKGANQ